MSFRFVNHPLALFVLSLLLLAAAAYVGTMFRRERPLTSEQKDELNLVVGGVLTLLGLIIGFTFSMAVARFDLRRADEAAEANAIGTEYARAGLLESADTVRVRLLLNAYLNERIEWYQTHSFSDAKTSEQKQSATERAMWSIVERSASANPTAVRALVAAGMNETIDNAGYAKAAWENRIPLTAWILMMLIAMCASGLLGFNVATSRTVFRGTYLVPVVVSIAFFLIADLDSTRFGSISIVPNDLVALQDQLKGR